MPGGDTIHRTAASLRRALIGRALRRGGRACRRCCSRIVVERLGEHARYSFRCPACQAG